MDGRNSRRNGGSCSGWTLLLWILCWNWIVHLRVDRLLLLALICLFILKAALICMNGAAFIVNPDLDRLSVFLNV